jgi:hypothetical protein
MNPLYLRFKNFPDYIVKQDIIDLLDNYSIPENDIVLSYDIFGRKTGDVIIRIYHLTSYKDIITTYNFYYFNEKYIIELFETNENDFISCKKSIEFSKNNVYTHENKIRKIFLKLSKLPMNVKEEDIKQFFKNYTLAENGIKFNKFLKGSTNNINEAVIAFQSENDCLDALNRENERILNNQMINLNESSLDEYEEFASSEAFNKWMKIISEKISASDVTRSLYIRGLPLDVKLSSILNYLKEFNLSKNNLICDEKILKENGSIIIKFYNEDDCNEAKDYINLNSFESIGRVKKLYVENLLVVVNKGNGIYS